MTMMTTIRFAKELLKTHPRGPGVNVAGNAQAAAAALAEIGLTDELVERMRTAHAACVAEWERSQPDYIPNLERWIESGEWEHGPPKKPVSRVMRIAMQMEAEEQKRKEKRK